MIVSGVECNLQILDVRSLLHRHHGLWFDLRSIVHTSIILLALIKSNIVKLVPGGAEVLFGFNFRPAFLERAQTNKAAEGHRGVFGGKLDKVLNALLFWEEESPDLRKSRLLLESLGYEVVQDLFSNRTEKILDNIHLV